MLRQPTKHPDAAASPWIKHVLRWAAVCAASAMLSGCYYHAMAGPAIATADSGHAGAVVSASGGLNGARGGVGLSGTGTILEGQYTGMLGVEAFRLWRGQSQTGIQPFVRGGLGLLELGSDGGDFLLGGLSPRGELGLAWLDEDLAGLTLSIGAEYRPRIDGPSTPLFWLQLGFGGFDYLDSGAPRPPRK